ncbi:MAG TPA: SRPBCC family protein [Acidimicrobiia bacterium]|nr:SRPBCC family protein [Acidimicrobiia bacterium]
MAVAERTRAQADALRLPGARAVVDEEKVVPMPLPLVRRLVRDVAAWPVWDPYVVESRLLSGKEGSEGMVHEVTVGVPAFNRAFVQMLVAASPNETVFGGGRGRDLRFIHRIGLADRGEATLVRRRLEIHLGRRLAGLRRPIRALARAYVRRSLDALT